MNMINHSIGKYYIKKNMVIVIIMTIIVNLDVNLKI